MNWSTDPTLLRSRGESRQGALRHAPGWALGVSAALHLVLVYALGGAWTASTSSDGVAASVGPPTVIRWIASSSEAAVSSVYPPSPVSAQAEGSSDPPESPTVPATATPPDPPGAPRAAPAQPSSLLDEEAARSSAGDLSGPQATVDSVDGYLPRKALSVPPSPLEHIALAWPPGMSVIGRQAAVFTVFIDETGVVRKMVADGPTLLPTLEAVAQATFGATPFAPGQVDGRPVKAMIRIEVVFDASVPTRTPPGEPPPAVVSRQNL